MSFCGPHLGYRDSENKLLHTGMLLLQHLRNVKWIKEVRLTDAERLEDCYSLYLYKLARTAATACCIATSTAFLPERSHPFQRAFHHP